MESINFRKLTKELENLFPMDVDMSRSDLYNISSIYSPNEIETVELSDITSTDIYLTCNHQNEDDEDNKIELTIKFPIHKDIINDIKSNIFDKLENIFKEEFEDNEFNSYYAYDHITNFMDLYDLSVEINDITYICYYNGGTSFTLTANESDVEDIEVELDIEDSELCKLCFYGNTYEIEYLIEDAAEKKLNDIINTKIAKSKERSFKYKSIYQLSTNDKLIHKFSNIKEASIVTGISYSCINKCVRGVSKSAGGYKWKGESYSCFK